MIDEAIRPIRQAGVDVMKNSIATGWSGTSFLVVTDLKQGADVKGKDLDLSKNIYSIVDGAHRFTAVKQLAAQFTSTPANTRSGYDWNNLLIPCLYIKNMADDDRLKYAYGFLILLFFSL